MVEAVAVPWRGLPEVLASAPAADAAVKVVTGALKKVRPRRPPAGASNRPSLVLTTGPALMHWKEPKGPPAPPAPPPGAPIEKSPPVIWSEAMVPLPPAALATTEKPVIRTAAAIFVSFIL